MLIDQLGDTTKEDIKLVCHKLFHENYITEFVFAPNENLKKANSDYSFLLHYYDEIGELLQQCGWELCRDDRVNVIYITSTFTMAKVVLSKTESYFLFALRLLYDQKKTQASASGEIFIFVNEIVEQLSTLGAMEPVTKQERERALRTLQNKNIITRITGKLSDIDAKIAILPSVVCAISAKKVELLTKSLSDQDKNTDVEEEDEE